jgi:hypothetical protein
LAESSDAAPNVVVDFLDAETLAGKHGGDAAPLAIQAEPSAGGISIMAGSSCTKAAGP